MSKLSRYLDISNIYVLQQAVNLGWEVLEGDSPETITSFNHSKSHLFQ